jgi:hypothetical protein
MSPSTSFTAIQCHLNEAMELLDPPPPSSLTVAGIAKAYDCLLSAASTSSSLEHNAMSQSSFDDSWCSLQADIYRGLLLSAHLLLGMAPRKGAGRNVAAKDGGNGTTKPNPCDGATSPTWFSTIVMTPDDVMTLEQTQKRCRLLLFQLAEMSHGQRYGGKICLANGGHTATDWHDDILPRSSFQLLRECFELGDSGPDGSEERLVSLNFDSNECVVCHLSAYDVVEKQGAVVGREGTVGIDREMDANDEDNDDDDIGRIGFDRKILEREENELLDVAIPINAAAITAKRPPKKGKKRKRNDMTNSPPPSIAKQGYLVLVNNDINSECDKGVRDSSSFRRYFAKLGQSGVLCLQLAGNDKAAAVQFYLGAEQCKCKPRPLGDTFHFMLEAAKPLKTTTTNASLHSAIGDVELTFKVDEETGGGLAEGFAWVTAITQVAKDSSLRREQQDKINQEWAENAEWKAVANERAATFPSIRNPCLMAGSHFA